jgi:hypothetical protein
MPLTQPSPPQGGEGFILRSPLPVGEGWVRAFLLPLLGEVRAKLGEGER